MEKGIEPRIARMGIEQKVTKETKRKDLTADYADGRGCCCPFRYAESTAAMSFLGYAEEKKVTLRHEMLSPSFSV